MRKVFNAALSAPLLARSRKREIGLIFKLKRPRASTLKIRPIQGRKRIDLSQHRRRISGIERSIRIRILGMLWSGTSRATFGIRLTQNNWRFLPLRKRRNHLKSTINRCQLLANSHPNLAVFKPRRSLGMEVYGIEERPSFAGREVLSTRAVFEKQFQKLCDSIVAGPRGIRGHPPVLRAKRAGPHLRNSRRA
jgi:hypothetical protein